MVTAVRAVLYCIFRFIWFLCTFDIRITFKNETDHVINKMIEQIIFIPDLWKWILKYVHLQPIRTEVWNIVFQRLFVFCKSSSLKILPLSSWFFWSYQIIEFMLFTILQYNDIVWPKRALKVNWGHFYVQNSFLAFF